MFFKRILDVGFSTLLLVALAPFLLLVALAIKLDSPGPVFYISDRIGRCGRVFRCLKFRTMERDAESRRSQVIHLNERDKVLFKVRHDPRVTRLGRLLRKYSLDELPQFFNVLSGHMSVVGPRPPLASEVTEYGPAERERLVALPGITGLWQVQGRHDPSFDTYVSLDLTYIDNWSLALDLKIMLRTLSVVLAGSGT
jgi:lipopolysaccharide/colanic/teichoic acid biosynthesis glycosyltransferase